MDRIELVVVSPLMRALELMGVRKLGDMIVALREEGPLTLMTWHWHGKQEKEMQYANSSNHEESHSLRWLRRRCMKCLKCRLQRRLRCRALQC